MSDTKIEWTDATVNFWWGCTKVGPGCDGCYAETWSNRFGGGLWGAGAPRRKIKSAVKQLYRLDGDSAWWAADHYIGNIHDHPRRRVFIQSMSDLFDKEVVAEWFDEAWTTITRANRLEIQIVTKRVSFIEKRLDGRAWPNHAGLIISVVNQDEADRDISRLIDLKQRLGIPWVGLSMEPLLGPVVLRPEWLKHLDWVIVGGESGPNARPMYPDWARSLRDQCAAAGVPFFFKQWGEWGEVGHEEDGPAVTEVRTQRGRDMHSARAKGLIGFISTDGQFFDHEDKIRGRARLMHRVGKKAAGRLLDGVEHNGFPATGEEGAAVDEQHGSGQLP